MVTVKVIRRSSGEPVKGAKVALSMSGLGRGITDGELTDFNGEAHFDVKPGQGKVIINGSAKEDGNLSGRIVVYI